MDLLDNPVWHALTGPQKNVADTRSGAARYQPDVALFSGVPDKPGSTTWDDLRDLNGPGGVAILFVRPSELPDTWEGIFELHAVQMVATSVKASAFDSAEELGPDDVQSMRALVGRTEPGPFGSRTIELGEYIGVRDERGTLVAMAGERMNPPGFREISAVCTDEAFRGRGYASALVKDLCGRIEDRGEMPMLHVVSTNVAAIRVYETLGFTIRREVDAIGVRSPH